MNLQSALPSEIRAMIRDNKLIQHTSGMAKGYIQANVVILPERYAYDFLKFCYRNPKSCPLLDITEVGEFSFPKYGPDAYIRTDVGEYYVYRDGVHVETLHDIKDLYREDMVAFIIGCSFTFEHAFFGC